MNKQKLFKTAWAIANQFETFGEALKQAWKLMKLKVKMMAGNASFKYRKVSGEIREAVGTLNFSYEAKGSGRTAPVDSVVYFDRDANGIRSFKISNLV